MFIFLAIIIRDFIYAFESRVFKLLIRGEDLGFETY